MKRDEMRGRLVVVYGMNNIGKTTATKALVDYLGQHGIYAQNRRDYQPRLEETLESGVWVVAEDYTGTGIGWGMIFGEPQEELERLNVGLLPADVSVLMDGERFNTGVEKGHLHEEDGRWEQGRKIFQSLTEKYGWVVMSSEGTKEEVLERLIGLVERKFPGCLERVCSLKERK